MNDLEKLLINISTNKVQSQDLQEVFDEIAVCLLRQTKIVTPKDHFYLREIEIYFFEKENNPDPYTHKNKRQSEFGEWYFHRFTDITTFLNSNRNGLDITFGSKAKNIFGGILIRKMQNLKTDEIIVGINRVVRKLIENIGEENVNEIALGIGQKAFNKDQLLHLEVDENNYSMPIYKTQRNGLTFKEDELSKKYFKIAYCYYNHNLNVSQIIEVRPAM
jgi:hypothetical protein